MVIFGIALAVAVVPEALPAVVTISLAIGVQRMVKRHALIRRLTAVEALGSVSVICSDKTGTLTKDEMTARRILVAGATLEVSGAGYEPQGAFLRSGSPMEPSAVLLDLLRAGTLASDAQIVQVDGRWEVKGDPTEGALVVAAAKAGLQKSELDSPVPAHPGDPVHLRDQAHDHAPRDAGWGDRLRQGRPRGDPGLLHAAGGRIRRRAARRHGARGHPGRRAVDGERGAACPGRRLQARRDASNQPSPR